MTKHYLLDQAVYSNDMRFSPFILTDFLIADASKKKNHFLHFWECDQTMILGMKDTRVPYFEEAIHSLLSFGYTPVIRNSGGLGVIADNGILNISLIFSHPEHSRYTIDEGYQKMVTLTQDAFPEKKIDVYEIENSYCPGTYDLSIDGKKFAGIAQRRVKDGIAVMMYLSVTGDQSLRGEIVQKFYQAGLKEAFGEQGYPAVDPATMANLSSLLDIPLQIDDVKQRIATSYSQLHQPPQQMESTDWRKQVISDEEWQQNLQKMIRRNQELKEFSHDTSL
ncbi:MAG: biotin/lipoate A/B protein ligase family protein [Enterococcus sp.]